MKEMTTYERFKRMYEHKEADRIPIIDDPWETTIARWHNEGMPKNMDFSDFFDLDHLIRIRVDNSPQYEKKVIEETPQYKIYTTAWGVTLKEWKHITSTPEFINFTIRNRESWAKAKARMKPTKDRINWDWLAQNYQTWREKGYWLQGDLWFGFDITHSWTIGTERILMALIEDPDWCVDMFNHFLDVNTALLDMVWDAGYKFDSAFWYDDMGYKGKQFFSVKTYRELIKPVHKKAIDWAHKKGIKAHLHSCGNVMPFIPELIGIGLDALNPIEVKAGMDPVVIKKQYGKDLVLHGGINAVLWDNLDAMEADIRKVVPELKKNGGYIFSTDHSVPDNVSADGFRRIIKVAKEVGQY